MLSDKSHWNDIVQSTQFSYVSIAQTTIISCYIIGIAANSNKTHTPFSSESLRFWLSFLYLICNQYEMKMIRRTKQCLLSYSMVCVCYSISVFFRTYAFIMCSHWNRDYLNNMATCTWFIRELLMIEICAIVCAVLLVQQLAVWLRLKVQTLTNRSDVIVRIASWINHLWLKWINTITETPERFRQLQTATDRWKSETVNRSEIAYKHTISIELIMSATCIWTHHLCAFKITTINPLKVKNWRFNETVVCTMTASSTSYSQTNTPCRRFPFSVQSEPEIRRSLCITHLFIMCIPMSL